jgi:hypothetical protein
MGIKNGKYEFLLKAKSRYFQVKENSGIYILNKTLFTALQD